MNSADSFAGRSRRRVMFYSGAAYESDKEQALEAAAEAYVVKPELGGLLTAVQGYCKSSARALYRSQLFIASANRRGACSDMRR